LTSREWELARAATNNALTNITAPMTSSQLHNLVLQARHRVDSAYTKLQNAETLTCEIENNLNIQERWTISSPEYQKFHEENIRTDYQTALDELERLVVMRLFELTKMSMSGTGMLCLY
jgi:hypothetical protein